MQRVLLVIIFFACWTLSFAQRYNSDEIIKKADSIMRATVGERIFKDYLRYDSSSYYEFRSFFGKTNWETLTDFKKTKGKFRNVSVRYSFCLNKYHISCLGTSVQLDSALNQTGSIATHFIPDYVLDNTKCNLIDDTTALKIAKTKFTREGIKPITVALSYDHNKKLYMWSANNVLTKNIDSFGKEYGEIQIVEMDALTGKIINFHPDAFYGPIR